MPVEFRVRGAATQAQARKIQRRFPPFSAVAFATFGPQRF
jgi:hypothetical protein